jgi:hypothetical protein
VVTIDERRTCPKCSNFSLEYEERYDDFREGCSECGYFREGIYLGGIEKGRRGEETLKLLKLGFDFNPELDYFIREGYLKKSDDEKGNYLIVDSWFDLPSDLSGIEVEWISGKRQTTDKKTALTCGEIEGILETYWRTPWEIPKAKRFFIVLHLLKCRKCAQKFITIKEANPIDTGAS